ncbi:MAG: type II toxin-antitoxin system Phd/YefM family antitoxin [Acidimicrobiales bacterium]
MRVGVRELRNRTGEVVEAVRSGARVVLTVHGEAVADIVPHGQRSRWLAGEYLSEQLGERSADPGLAGELDELAGATLDQL